MKEITPKMMVGRSIWTMNTKMFYPFYKLKGGVLPSKKYNKIHKAYHKVLNRHLLEGDHVNLPNQFGLFTITQVKGISHSLKQSSLNQQRKKKNGEEIYYNKVFYFGGRESFRLNLKLGFKIKHGVWTRSASILGVNVKKRNKEYSGK